MVERHVDIELVRDRQHGHHVLLIGVHLERDLPAQYGDAVLEGFIIGRQLLRIAVRRLLLLHVRLHAPQVVAQHLRDAHSRHRHAVLAAVYALGVDAHRRLERDGVGDHARGEVPARRLDRHAPSADDVAAARRNAAGGDAVGAADPERLVLRVDGVQRVQLGRHRVGQLIDVAAALARDGEVRAVRVRIDEARHDDAPGQVDDLAALLRQVRADGRDLSAVDEHVAVLDDLRLVHGEHGRVFQQ